MKEKGLTYILSAPAGTGKTTLVSKLTTEFTHIVKTISYTTRAPREGEVDGKDYHFVSFQQFKRMIEKGEFLEYAQVFDHFYGTSKIDLKKLTDQGKDVVLVIDTQGALAIKKFYNGVYIFMSPPSIKELESRLTKRKSESHQDIQKRLKWAHKEMETATSYDYNIINCDLAKTYQVLKSIFIAEKFRVKNQLSR